MSAIELGRPEMPCLQAPWRFGVRRDLLTPLLIGLLALAIPGPAVAQSPPDLPRLLSEDFEHGLDRWEFLEPSGWELRSESRTSGAEPTHVLHQFEKSSNYEPPYRSPFHIALLREPVVSDFVLDAQVRSTHEDYGHRDCCLFFGYRDSAHFYYVHLGKQTDEHANQIFVVDGAPRVKISTQTTDGTPWTDAWHQVRIVRQTESGSIEVYFDDMQQPVMRANDRRFRQGRVGVGSFDDTSAWDDIVLSGNRADEGP